MTNWLERATLEIPKKPRHYTANSDERNLTAVTAVPFPYKTRNSTVSNGSNGSAMVTVFQNTQAEAIARLDELIDRVAAAHNTTPAEVVEMKACARRNVSEALECYTDLARQLDESATEREAFEERAAIIQYDGGYSRDDAERLVLDRLSPPMHERAIAIDLPDTSTAAGVSAAQQAILKAVGAGDLLPGEANTLAGILGSRRKAIETHDLTVRLEELERKAASK